MLDAADVSTIGLSGSSVVRWSDKSALHNDVAAAQTGAPPSYVAGRNGGLGNIAFNGQNQLLVGSNSAFSQNLFNESTVFIVSNQNAAKQDASVLWTGCFFCNPRWTLRLSEGPGNTPTFAFNNKTQGSGLLFAGGVASGPAIWTAAGSISAKTQFLNRDGVLVGSDGGPGAAVSGSYPEAIGAMYQAPKTATYYYGGSLGEVVVYNRLLAQSEYQLVEGGLACKWGLQNQLPVTHPYRYKCPGQLPSATTYHYDNARTGWDPNEQILNTSNVNAAHFGLKFSVPLDGEVYAEPLYVPQVAMSGGVHNLLVAATENATVYGIDADSGAVLWKTPFANPPNVIASIAIGANSNVAGPNGLTGTPTIDVARDSIYVVGHTDEGPAALKRRTTGFTRYVWKTDPIACLRPTSRFRTLRPTAPSSSSIRCGRFNGPGLPKTTASSTFRSGRLRTSVRPPPPVGSPDTTRTRSRQFSRSAARRPRTA